MENIKWLVLLGLFIVSTLGTDKTYGKIEMENTWEDTIRDEITKTLKCGLERYNFRNSKTHVDSDQQNKISNAITNNFIEQVSRDLSFLLDETMQNLSQNESISKYSIRLLLRYLIKWRNLNKGHPPPRVDVICEGLKIMNENNIENLMNVLIEEKFLVRYLGLFPGMGVKQNEILSVLHVFDENLPKLQQFVLQSDDGQQTLLHIAVKYCKFHEVVEIILDLDSIKWIFMQDVHSRTCLSTILKRINYINALKKKEKKGRLENELYDYHKMLIVFVNFFKKFSIHDQLLEYINRTYITSSPLQLVLQLLSDRFSNRREILPGENHYDLLKHAGKDHKLLGLFFYFLKNDKFMYNSFYGNYAIFSISLRKDEMKYFINIDPRCIRDLKCMLWTLVTEWKTEDHTIGLQSMHMSEAKYLLEEKKQEIILGVLMYGYAYNIKPLSSLRKHLFKLICKFLIDGYIIEKMFKNQ